MRGRRGVCVACAMADNRTVVLRATPLPGGDDHGGGDRRHLDLSGTRWPLSTVTTAGMWVRIGPRWEQRSGNGRRECRRRRSHAVREQASGATTGPAGCSCRRTGLITGRDVTAAGGGGDSSRMCARLGRGAGVFLDRGFSGHAGYAQKSTAVTIAASTATTAPTINGRRRASVGGRAVTRDRHGFNEHWMR